jgi:hypothetical protein
MPMLRGIETTAIGRSKTVEVAYENRKYVDRQGRPVPLIDMTCYSCQNSYYVLEAEPIDYCPHCGRREGQTPWTSHDDAVRWAMPQSFAYLRKLGIEPYALRRSDNVWVLGFGRNAEAMLGAGRYLEARSLLPSGGA